MIPPPVSEADFLAPPPVLDPTPSGSPEEEAPVIEPKESAPSAEELAHTVPTSPNLHKAFATDYVSEGQHTNLAKAAKGPDVRVPDMPADVLAPEGASQASAPKRSNLQQVIRHEEDHTEQARKDFVDFLKDNHPFEYLYMCDCSVFWKDQTVWCIMPNSFAQSIEEIKTNPAVLPNLLKLCQKYEPALLHARVATKDEYEKIKDDDGPSDIPESKGQPDWVKAIEKASQENGIPIDHVTDM